MSPISIAAFKIFVVHLLCCSYRMETISFSFILGFHVFILHTPDSLPLFIDCYWFSFQNGWAHDLLAELSSPPVTGNLISVELLLECPTYLHHALATLSPLPSYQHVVILLFFSRASSSKNFLSQARWPFPVLANPCTDGSVIARLPLYIIIDTFLLFPLICELPEAKQSRLSLDTWLFMQFLKYSGSWLSVFGAN